MADQWTLHGVEFENCPCAWGCPCQFGAQPTYGRCEALMGGHIEEGNFNDTNLDGLDWAMLLSWPGPVPEGNGTQQAIIDERADPTQREALRKILHGESTTPGATVFFVYNSTMSTVLEPLYAPIELSIDVDQRTASMTIEGLVSHAGSRSPIRRTRDCRPGSSSVRRRGRAISMPRWATATPQRGRESSLTSRTATASSTLCT